MGAPHSGRRRVLLGALATSCLGLISGCGVRLPGTTRSPHARRIGIVNAGTADTLAESLTAFREGMQELGYAEGRDYTLEIRFAAGKAELLPRLADEVVGLHPDIILTSGHEAIRACMRATQTIPIVFATAGDPVSEGLVASLARPGGNVTGLSHRAGQEEYAKRLQILREVVPGLRRLAILAFRRAAREVQETEALARAQGLEPITLELPSPDAVDAVLGVAITERADALFVSTDAVLNSLAPRIVAFARDHRLPSMYATENYVQAGGLLSYGARLPENWRRAATYVDKIWKGARPADLPVELPTKFFLLVNHKTAQMIGLEIPPSVLSQVTDIIE